MKPLSQGDLYCADPRALCQTDSDFFWRSPKTVLKPQRIQGEREAIATSGSTTDNSGPFLT
ncbi:MAG: hypothetical protein AB8B99_20055 [Phormidesmis sp.]